MVRMAQALARITADLPEQLNAQQIERACHDAGHAWRRRLLDPVTTVYLLLLQVLHQNTACAHLPHLSGRTFSASAYCQARRRLPLAVLSTLLARLTESARSATERVGRWHGHRTFLIDGSACLMPDTPAHAARFGKHSGHRGGTGFPMGHLLAMFDASTGLLTAIKLSRFRTSDTAGLPAFHRHLRPDDLLVGDRAFGVFMHLALLSNAGIQGLFRLHRAVNVDFTPSRSFRHPSKPSITYKGWPRSRWIRTLGRDDQVVEYFRPKRRSAVMDREQWERLPDSIVVRELRYRIERRGFRTRTVVLVTTLLDPERYPRAELAELYRRRWQVEVDLRHLKQTLGMTMVKCGDADGVLKEVTAFALIYNLVRLVMADSAREQGVSPERISFIDALRWLQAGGNKEGMGRLVVNPVRTGRVEPRAIKRGRNRYPWMTRSRRVLRQELLQHEDAA